jgi:site-specific DNA-methyltransferase (adenine-specific)
MTLIADGSIDMILCDLPYGVTDNMWDSVIPLEPLWAHYTRVIKPKGAIVLTAQTPFDKVLGCSNLKWLRCEWIWEKDNATNFLNTNKYPLRAHENVLVFASGLPTYNPQKTQGKPYKAIQHSCSSNYSKTERTATANTNGLRYPRTIIQFNTERTGLHPTQKPVALFEYLIRTYTNPGELVLDNCIGSGTTAIACLNCDRDYIGFESDEKYFKVAQDRVAAHRMPGPLKANLNVLFEAN